jgi:hypothetical protein
MTDQPDGKRRSWPTWIGIVIATKNRSIAVVALLLLYALSIGPAARVVGHDPSRLSEFRMAYWPLRQFARLELIGAPLISYINLWMPDLDDCEAFRDENEGVNFGWGAS